MKVGVLSDTHDRLTTFRRAVALFIKRLKVDALFHAGDFVAPFAARLIAPSELPMPVHCVYGNNDGERKGLKSILPGVVITGHTHEVVNETRDGTLLLNPGECCGWVTDRCTAAVLDMDSLKAENLEVHE